MVEDARLLLVEMVIPTSDEMSDGKWLDLEMLVCFGGRERTEEEYRTLLADAGYRLTRIVPTHTPASLIEAVPASSSGGGSGAAPNKADGPQIDFR